jgi:hypothetical protein
VKSLRWVHDSDVKEMKKPEFDPDIIWRLTSMATRSFWHPGSMDFWKNISSAAESKVVVKLVGWMRFIIPPL